MSGARAMVGSCLSCRFFGASVEMVGDLKTRDGFCRIKAPTLQGWPRVFETDWCAEFSPLPTGLAPQPPPSPPRTARLRT